MAPHPTANLTFLKQLWALIGQWCLKQRSRFSSPSHEPEPDSRGVTSQELETSELEQIQSAHMEWLASNGKSGQRADLRNRIVPTEWLGNLSKADLRGACILPRRYADNVNALFEGANLRDATIKESHLGKSFIGTDLSRATWTGACLCNADLSEAVLVEANLSRPDFTGANLSGANLKDACLRDANLENTYGLLAVALRGADVGNAKLPPAIAAFDALKTVEASSQNRAKVFILLLAACSYAWLTVATATDAGLLTNSGTSKWPIIQTEVPIVWFFWLAPLILLCIYVYLHVHLQRLWEVLSDLPAVFPDGRPLDKRTYPWLLNDLVRADFTRLRGSQPLLGGIQRVLSIFLAWWLMPLTLLVFWVRYLPKHSWLGTGFHVLLFSFTSLIALVFYRIARATLRGTAETKSWKHPWLHAGFYGRGFVAIVLAFFIAIISYGAIRGAPDADFPLKADPTANGLQRNVPRVLGLLHCSPFANLNFADVSSKPASWTGLDQHRSEELALVKGVRLSRRQDLRYVSGIDMFFAKGIANGADFSYGRLTGANFENAHLIDADFSNAWCADANFHFAQLIRANLVGTDLSGADLRGADMMYAKFGRTTLTGANLQGASFGAASLGSRVFGLTGEQLREAKGWNLTTLPRKLINELNLPYDHNARVTSNDFSEYHFDGMDLQGISFRNTNLRGAKLCNARLQGVDFAGANLTGADLTGAYLTGAKITKAQVASAVVDENTRLPFFSTDDSSEPPAKHSP